MIIRTPALAAAERLMQQCPVRTHIRMSEHYSRKGIKPTRDQSALLRVRIERLRSHGLKIRQIALETGISDRAVKKHLRAIKDANGG